MPFYSIWMESSRQPLEFMPLPGSKRAGDKPFEPFDKQLDYEDYVDGKPRYDGAQSFLESRHIYVPAGSPDDPPDKETVWGIANRKNKGL